MRSLSYRKLVLSQSYNQPAHHINHHNQQPCDGIATHKLAGPIHGPIKLGLLRDRLPTLSRLLFANQTCIQIGIDSHLLARHGDRKSTRLNSSHVAISYAVFCLKKKTKKERPESPTGREPAWRCATR